MENEKRQRKESTRPCMVNGEKGRYHQWAEITVYNGVVGGSGTQETPRKAVVAIVEFEDGTVGQIEPQNIRFVNSEIKETMAKAKPSKDYVKQFLEDNNIKIDEIFLADGQIRRIDERLHLIRVLRSGENYATNKEMLDILRGKIEIIKIGEKRENEK